MNNRFFGSGDGDQDRGQQQDNQTDDRGQNQNNDRENNNGGNNEDNANLELANPWEPREEKNQGNGGNENNSNGGGNQNQQQDNGQVLSTYVQQNYSLPEFTGEQSKEIMEGVHNGDLGPLHKILNAQFQNLATRMLGDSAQIVNSSSKKLTEQFGKFTESSVASNKMVDNLNERLPMTREKSVAPLARTVLNRFHGIYGDGDQAINATVKYFEDMASKMGYKKPTSQNRPGSGANHGGGNSAEGSADDINWDEVFQ